MIELYIDKSSPRAYTDAFYDFMIDCGYLEENNPLTNLMYWLSDDDVKRYAEINFDITFIEDEDEED